MKFTKSQEKAINTIKQFINNPMDRVLCLSGSPGTGKSFIIKNALPSIIGKKWNYLITATTNKASSLLGGETVHSAFGITVRADYNTGKINYDYSRARDLQNTIIVIDEASMLDFELWNAIQDRAVMNCKFLLVGDKYQLPAVKGSADVFEHYDVIELTEVVRQKKADLLQEISRAKQGVIDNTINDICPCGSVKLFSYSDKKQIQDLLKTFTHEDKILTYTNNRAIEYSTALRALQGKSNDLQEGDDVMSRNYCETPNGGRNTSIHCEEELVISDIGDPREIELNGYKLSIREVNFVDKEGTYICAEDWQDYQRLVKQCAKDKDWKAYFFFKEKVLDLRTNEACTVHCSQGSTYNRVFIDLTDIKSCKAHSTKARLLYVALSRAKEEVYVYAE